MTKFFNSFSFNLACCLMFILLFAEGTAVSGQKKKSGAANAEKIANLPRIERGDCALALPPGENSECGYLVTTEDRPAIKGKIIRLPFIKMKSDSPAPLPDPILYTGGGPGGSSLGQVKNRQYIPFLKNRDYIIFEQRGTKYAEPSLQCPEVNDAQVTAAKQNLNKFETTAGQLVAVRACRERLVKSGINLSAYNSRASAGDIEDLRRLLGYEKWNLYGISYSTRLMLTVMRDFPNGVRSVILDSVLPPVVNYDETSVDSVVSSLNMVFAACRAAADCQAKYPDLEKQFYSLVQKLDEKPAAVSLKDSQTGVDTTLLLNGSDVVNGIYETLENSGNLVWIPALISNAAQNNDKAMTALAKIKLNVSGFAWGMRYSVWCSEEMPFQNRALIKRQITTAYPNLRGFGIQSDFPAICDAWKVEAADKIENQPVRSSIPALILAGQFDPDTPPVWGKLTAKTLSNSRFIEIPAMSHVPTFGSSCAQELVTAFLNNPLGSIDSQCISKIPPIRFELTNGK